MASGGEIITIINNSGKIIGTVRFPFLVNYPASPARRWAAPVNR
jgi:hypothetical protein